MTIAAQVQILDVAEELRSEGVKNVQQELFRRRARGEGDPRATSSLCTVL